MLPSVVNVKTLKVLYNCGSRTVKGQVCVTHYFKDWHCGRKNHLLKQVTVLVKKLGMQKQTSRLFKRVYWLVMESVIYRKYAQLYICLSLQQVFLIMKFLRELDKLLAVKPMNAWLKQVKVWKRNWSYI